MKLLAIDTTESGCSAALHIDGENHGIFELAPRKHSELILPMIDRILSDASVSQNQLRMLTWRKLKDTVVLTINMQRS